MKNPRTKLHMETGSPYPFWLEIGFPSGDEKKKEVELVEQLFGDLYSPLQATNWKYHQGSYVLMFRSQDDRFLYEVSSNQSHTRIDPKGDD